MNVKKNFKPITIEGSLQNNSKRLHVGNDVLLLESVNSFDVFNDPRRMSLCLFIGVCTSGIITMNVNDKRRSATHNQVLLITDESVISDIRYSDDFDGFGFLISYQFLQDILKDVRNMSDLFLLTHNHPVFNLTEKEILSARNYYRIIREHIMDSSTRYRLEIIRLTMLTMIYDMAGAFDRAIDQPGKNEKQSRSEQIFVEFVQRVENNYREHRQVQWYAGEMGLTPKYLCEVISSVSRRSPNEWIDKFVTSEMRNLLRHTNMKMNEIAKVMNFPTQSFFGKYFKENVGVSPSDYRNGREADKKEEEI